MIPFDKSQSGRNDADNTYVVFDLRYLWVLFILSRLTSFLLIEECMLNSQSITNQAKSLIKWTKYCFSVDQFIDNKTESILFLFHISHSLPFTPPIPSLFLHSPPGQLLLCFPFKKRKKERKKSRPPRVIHQVWTNKIQQDLAHTLISWQAVATQERKRVPSRGKGVRDMLYNFEWNV